MRTPLRVPNASNFESACYQQLIDEVFTETNDEQLKGQLRELTQTKVARSAVKKLTYDRSSFYKREDMTVEK